MKLKRTVALVDEFVLDIFEAVSDQPHTYDYVLHVDGEPAIAPQESAPSLGARCGYQHLTDVRGLANALPWHGEWRTGADSIRIRLLGKGNAEVLSALGPTRTAAKKMEMLVVRQRARSATFLSLIEPRPNISGVTRAERREDDRCVVVAGRDRRYWLAWDGDTSRFRGTFACVCEHRGQLAASLVGAQAIHVDQLSLDSAEPLDCSIAIGGQTATMRVQRGSAGVALSAPLPTQARVYNVRDSERVAVPFSRRDDSWRFDVTANSTYLIRTP